MTILLRSVADLRNWRRQLLPRDKTIGLVTTMGNLHAGHQSLLERSKRENDITVLSIFVNPTQFDNVNDLAKYPKTFAADFRLAEKLVVDLVFAPEYDDLYPDDYSYKVIETEVSKIMEGKHRLNHFDGVLTVVMKLLLLVWPTKAYFGEKDLQQLELVTSMAKAFFLDIDIVSCPIVRDANGLALSSRNSRLSAEEYNMALEFPRILASRKSAAAITQDLQRLGFIVDYIEDYKGRRCGAVYVGKVRLIDNVTIAKEED